MPALRNSLWRCSTSRPYVLALSTLLLNDVYLKAQHPSWLTGKLSDLAGLALLGMIVGWVPAARARIVGLVTVAIGFALWKSPAAQPLIELVNSFGRFQVGRVVDYTDLIALPMLVLGARAAARMPIEARPSRSRRIAAGPLIAITVLAITGTSVIPYTQFLAIREPSAAARVPRLTETALVETLVAVGFECGGEGSVLTCRDGVRTAQVCPDPEVGWIMVQGPFDRGLLVPRTGKREARAVDELVTTLLAALPQLERATGEAVGPCPGVE